VNSALQEHVKSDNWDEADIISLLHGVRNELGLGPKPFMKVLRFALTATKVSSALLCDE